MHFKKEVISIRTRMSYLLIFHNTTTFTSQVQLIPACQSIVPILTESTHLTWINSVMNITAVTFLKINIHNKSTRILSKIHCLPLPFNISIAEIKANLLINYNSFNYPPPFKATFNNNNHRTINSKTTIINQIK